ncbi:MAG: ABC transporter substrate-binding protein, partial [Spirochaetota bacterium]|nr:ABC transporter substrate-binding protein [Spirochaetota bacterium]
ALKKLVYKDKVFAFVGPGSASLLNVLWKKIQENKLPTVSITMPDLAVEPFKKYIFIITDTYRGQVEVLVDYLVNDSGIKNPRAAVVYPDTEVGKIDLLPTIERLKKYKLEPVTKEVLHPASVDASSQVMSIKKNKANCILHVGTITPTTITLLRDLRKMGVKVPVFGSWGAMLGEALNKIGPATKMFYSVHATSPWYDKGSGMEEMRRITLKYHPGSEIPYRGTIYTHGWICNTILVEGLKRAGRDLDEDELIEALEDIEEYDTGGLCGPITYSSDSHKGGSSWKIYKSNPDVGKFIPMTDWRVPK